MDLATRLNLFGPLSKPITSSTKTSSRLTANTSLVLSLISNLAPLLVNGPETDNKPPLLSNVPTLAVGMTSALPSRHTSSLLNPRCLPRKPCILFTSRTDLSTNGIRNGSHTLIAPEQTSRQRYSPSVAISIPLCMSNSLASPPFLQPYRASSNWPKNSTNLFGCGQPIPRPPVLLRTSGHFLAFALATPTPPTLPRLTRTPRLVQNHLVPSRVAPRNSDLFPKKRKIVAVATTSAAIVVVRTTLLIGALRSPSALAPRPVKTYTVSAVPS